MYVGERERESVGYVCSRVYVREIESVSMMESVCM